MSVKRKVLAAIAAAALMLSVFAGAAAGHQITQVSGTVTCKGDFSISAYGDVYNPVTLTIKLGGKIVYGPALQGTNTSMRNLPFSGPVTGTGATVGESIEASTSDGSQASGKLTLTGGPCPQPDPKLTLTTTCSGKLTVNVNQDAITEGWYVVFGPKTAPVVNFFGLDPVTKVYKFVAGDNVWNGTPLSPGDYHWGVFKGTGSSTVEVGDQQFFTIVACPKAPAPPVTTCGGTASFSNVPDGWKLIIEPGDHLYTSGFSSISLVPGDYSYQWRDADNNDITAEGGGGKFTIKVCPSASPQPSPTSKSTTTPPPTTNVPGVPSGSSDNGLLVIIGIFGSIGAAIGIQYGRRWQHRHPART